MDNVEASASKGHLRWLKIAVFILIFAAAIFCILLYSIGNARQTSAIQEARADGGPVTLDELLAARKTYPPDQDGAVHLLKIAQRLEAIAKDPDIEKLPLVGDGRMPPLGRLWNPQEAANVAAALERLAAEMGHLAEIRRFPGGSFPFKPGADPIQWTAPNLSELRFAAKLQALNMLAEAMEGKTHTLVEAVDIQLRLATLINDHPTLIAPLLKAAMIGLNLSTIEQVLALAPADDAQLRQLDSLLAGADIQETLLWGLRGERAIFLEVTETYAKGPLRLIRGFDQSCGIRIYNAHIRAVQNRTNTPLKLDESIPEIPSYAILSRTLAPSFGRAMALCIRAEALLAAARAGLAAERYRLARGSLPGDLQQLVPGFLDVVPTDPFSGEPLRYRHTDEGVIIYSVDLDRKDGGGDVPALDNGKTREFKDAGFVLLKLELRRRPPLAPETAPARREPIRPAGSTRTSSRSDRPACASVPRSRAA